MRLHFSITALLVILAARVLAQDGATDPQRPRFTSGVSLVTVGAVVRDDRNRLVHDLTRQDFEVLEDGKPQPIVDFKFTDQGPISVALLVDVSGSMGITANFQAGRNVVEHLLDSMKAGTDELALFTFDKTIREEIAFTDEFGRVRDMLGRIAPFGLTSLYDGIAQTAKALGARPSPRRAVVVITDGVDTSSVMTGPQVSGLASSVDVPVYVIAVVAPVDHPEKGIVATGADSTQTNLSHLAYWTGGTTTFVSTATQANAAVRDVITELRQQYILAIEASSVPGWHRLEVKTPRRGHVVRARSGYFSGAGRVRGVSNGQPAR